MKKESSIQLCAIRTDRQTELFLELLSELKTNIPEKTVDQSWENSTDGDNITMSSMNGTGHSQKKTFLEFDKCTPLDDVTPWCYTRVDENGTYILGKYIFRSNNASVQKLK